MPSFKNAIDEFIKCRVVVGEQTIEGKTFLNSLLCAVRTVEEVESIKQYGVRVDYMLGRIKG